MPTPLRNIRIDEPLWQATKTKVIAEGTTVSALVRALLIEWLDKTETETR